MADGLELLRLSLSDPNRAVRAVALEQDVTAAFERPNDRNAAQHKAAVRGVELLEVRTEDPVTDITVPRWIELIPAEDPDSGVVEIRDWREGFKMDPAELVAQFEAKPVDRRRSPIDWCHMGHRWDPGRSPAAGWILELRVGEGNNLEGRVEWTKDGAQDVGERLYLYISPVVLLAWPVGDDGLVDFDGTPRAVELVDAALTNTPATHIRSLAETPIEVEPDQTIPLSSVPPTFASRPLPASSLAAQEIKPMTTQITAATLSALGLDADAPAQLIEDKIVSLATRGETEPVDPDAISKMIDDKLARLSETAAAASSDAANKARVSVMLDSATAAGRLRPYQREAYEALGITSGADKLAESLAKLTESSLTTTAGSSGTPSADEVTMTADEEKVAARVMNISSPDVRARYLAMKTKLAASA